MKTLDPEFVAQAIVKSLRNETWVRENNVDALWDAAIADEKARPLARLVALAGLCDPCEGVRNKACEALYEIGSPRDAGAVSRMCKDESWLVRASAYSTLGRLSGKRYLKRIIGGMDDWDPVVRRYAAVAVADVLGTSSADVIGPYYTTEEYDLAKVGMAYGMALSGSFEALLFLTNARDTEDPWIHEPAKSSLTELAKRGIAIPPTKTPQAAPKLEPE